MIRHETGSKPREKTELWQQVEALTRDNLQNPETPVTLAEHEADKQVFLVARTELVKKYRVQLPGKSDWRHFDPAEIQWENLTRWAFEPMAYLPQDICKTVALGPEDQQAIREISGLALETLLSHRQLAHSFSQLAPEDKRTLRPQQAKCAWSSYSRLETAKADIGRLIIGDAADRYIRQIAPGYDIDYQDRHLYSDAVQEILERRAEYLTRPLYSSYSRSLSSASEYDYDILRSFENTFRYVCGSARDNGDLVLWQAASRHLDPLRLKVCGKATYERPVGSPGLELPRPRLYLTDARRP